jgi:hypothetical protein
MAMPVVPNRFKLVILIHFGHFMRNFYLFIQVQIQITGNALTDRATSANSLSLIDQLSNAQIG